MSESSTKHNIELIAPCLSGYKRSRTGSAGKYVIGLNIGSMHKAKQLTVDVVCKATDGPSLYLGDNMKPAHTGLGITDSDWDISLEI